MKAYAAVALLIGLSACAAEPQGGPSISTAGTGRQQCFPVRMVNGFSAVDRDTVNVFVGTSNVYELDVFGICQELDWANVVALQPRGSSSTFVCDSTDVDVIAPSMFGPQRCSVTAMRKLSPTEVAALKNRPRPGS